MSLEATAISLKDANSFVEKFHRHHKPVFRDKFRVACYDGAKLSGVIQIGRPVSRHLDDGQTVEVVRCCTDGTKNACSFLYAQVVRASKAIGYKKIITYILESELGTSLKASGWILEENSCGGGTWNCKSRPRTQTAPTCKKQRWVKILKKENL